MFCTKCGSEVKEGLKFCPSCGNQMGTANVSKEKTKKSNDGAKSKKPVFLIIGVVAVLVIVFGIIKVLGSAGGNKVAKYTGSEFTDAIPSDYYNLIDAAPMINHVDFLDIEKQFLRTMDKGYLGDEATVMVCTEKYGKPTLVPSSYGMVESCEYSTKFDYVFIALKGIPYSDGFEYGLNVFDYTFKEAIPDPDKDLDAFIQWTYSDEVKGTGLWNPLGFDSVYEDDYEKMHGANIITKKELYADYSNMTYAEIANKLGSTGLLNYFQHFSDNGKIAATWYCPEADSVLAVMLNYELGDGNNSYNKVSDLAKHADYYENVNVETYTRSCIPDFERAIESFMNGESVADSSSESEVNVDETIDEGSESSEASDAVVDESSEETDKEEEIFSGTTIMGWLFTDITDTYGDVDTFESAVNNEYAGDYAQAIYSLSVANEFEEEFSSILAQYYEEGKTAFNNGTSISDESAIVIGEWLIGHDIYFR